jgi:hypothetical protein
MFGSMPEDDVMSVIEHIIEECCAQLQLDSVVVV